MFVRLDAEIDDLADIDQDGTVGGLDLDPALTAFLERLPQAGEHLFGEPQGEHLPALEPDRGATYGVGTQCAASTSSVRTPPAVLGCRNATCVPRMPVLGVSSISRIPLARAASSAAAMSGTP